LSSGLGTHFAYCSRTSAEHCAHPGVLLENDVESADQTMRESTRAAMFTHVPTEYRRAIDVTLVAVGTTGLVVQAWPLQRLHPAMLVLALALLTCLAWLWRERYPIGTLALNATGLVTAIVALHAYDWASAVAIVLLFFVALDGDRRRSLWVGAATAVILAGVLVALIPALERSDDLSVAGTRVLAALGALVVGDLVRSRLALRAAARERAARHLEELRERADRQAATERLQIARELHDTLAHALVAINVRAGVTAHLGGASAETEHALTEIKHVSAQALSDLRSTLDVLRDRSTPSPRHPALGLSSVPRLLDHAHAAGLDARAEVSLGTATVPSVIDHAGFRIIQESLTNIMRHARASQAHVRVIASDGMLTIDVTDNGETTAADGAENGHGLQGMAERAAAVGGTVSAGPQPHRGWRVHASLPLTLTPA
jgi:signal transduction histidine kinase